MYKSTTEQLLLTQCVDIGTGLTAELDFLWRNGSLSIFMANANNLAWSREAKIVSGGSWMRQRAWARVRVRVSIQVRNIAWRFSDDSPDTPRVHLAVEGQLHVQLGSAVGESSDMGLQLLLPVGLGRTVGAAEVRYLDVVTVVQQQIVHCSHTRKGASGVMGPGHTHVCMVIVLCDRSLFMCGYAVHLMSRWK